MKRILTSLLAVLVISTLTMVPAAAQEEPVPDPPEEPGFGRGFGPPLHEELDLSSEQITQLRDLRTSHQKEMIPLQADLKVARIELRELIRSGANETEINSKIDEIGRLRTQLEKKKVAHQLQMRSLLTPEQREKWEQGFGRQGSGRGGHRKDCPREPRPPRLGHGPGCRRF